MIIQAKELNFIDARRLTYLSYNYATYNLALEYNEVSTTNERHGKHFIWGKSD
jgi:hypothetical protein